MFKRTIRTATIGVFIAVAFGLAGICYGLDYPSAVSPGTAHGMMQDKTILLSNDVLAIELAHKDGKLRFVEFVDKQTGVRSLRGGELFEVRADGNGLVKCSDMSLSLDAPMRMSLLSGDITSRNLAERFNGIQVEAKLMSPDGRFSADWRLVLRDESNYAQQTVTFTAIDDSVSVKYLSFNHFRVDHAHTEGTVSGSPVVADTMFFAYEHPCAINRISYPGGWSNRALNQAVTASSAFPSYMPELAVNGNCDPRQLWGAAELPAWLMVDLGASCEIRDVRMVTYYDGTRYYGYEIEASDDGETWHGIVDAKDNRDVANADGYRHHLDNAQARYIKVTVQNNSDTTLPGAHIIELEVFGRTANDTAAEGTGVSCLLARNTELKKGRSLTQSAVLGVVPKKQLRRGFLYYLDRARVSPYKPFLHYNSWYDLTFAVPAPIKTNAEQCVEAINGLGTELVTKRGVTMDSFVIDDGWDDPETLWRMHKENFPDDWAPLVKAAGAYNSKLGVWLSPWGGYQETKETRLRYGKTQGFETGPAGFSLAGEKYFARFLGSCREFVDRRNVNFFKFDGTDAKFLNETEALLKLTSELYKTGKVDFISLTVGTWASPFWLMHCDSTWRGGADMNFTGKGSQRQRWITYRDADTYEKVVGLGPLYPINSLMVLGIAHANYGPAAFDNHAKDFADEAYSFFGGGTNLQELYVTHDRLTAAMYDIIAKGAKWSRSNAPILVDSHWIGGDPGKLEVYGFAAWQNDEGIMVLRNPDDEPKSISIDIGRIFELPDEAAQQYTMKTVFTDYAPDLALTFIAGQKQTVSLKPFQVLVLQSKGE